MRLALDVYRPLRVLWPSRARCTTPGAAQSAARAESGGLVRGRRYSEGGRTGEGEAHADIDSTRTAHARSADESASSAARPNPSRGTGVSGGEDGYRQRRGGSSSSTRNDADDAGGGGRAGHSHSRRGKRRGGRWVVEVDYVEGLWMADDTIETGGGRPKYAERKAGALARPPPDPAVFAGCEGVIVRDQAPPPVNPSGTCELSSSPCDVAFVEHRSPKRRTRVREAWCRLG